MLERRQHFRGRVYYGGRIAFNARNSTMDCIVRNFTPSGAKIEFTNAAILPDEVDLTIGCKGLAFLARIMWRRQHEAGFGFRRPRHLHVSIPLDLALRLRANERANTALRMHVERLRSTY